MIRPGIRRLFRLPLRRREVRESEVDDEIRLHLELRAEQLEAEGYDADQARAEARRRFGPSDEVRRILRDAARRREGKLRLREWLGGVRQDLVYTVRSLRRSPGFTAVAVLTLALGIGANTAIFSVVNGVLLHPLPLPEADRLAVVWESDRNSGTTREPASIPDFHDFRERSAQFASLAAFTPLEANFTPAEGPAARVAALAVSHDLLTTAGIEPLLGRGFTEAETEPGGPPVVMISEEMWERQFERRADVLGRTLQLNEQSHTVVGIVPSESDFGIPQTLVAADYGRSFADRGDRQEVEVLFPLQPTELAQARSSHSAFMLGRLRAGATFAGAQREMAEIAADLEAAHPENAGRGVYVEPYRDVVFGSVQPLLLLLMGAVGLVLLIACANVANLLLARGAGRRQEIAIRAALGAGRRRVARLFLVESLLLTGLGAALGVLVAFLGIGVLIAIAPANVARLDEVGVDGRALAVTSLIAVAVGLVFGLLPGLQRTAPGLHLRGGGGGVSSDPHSARLRSTLVAAEVGIAVVLLVGAGLLIKSFTQLVQVDPGFQAERVVKAEYQLPENRYPRDFSDWPNWEEIHRFNAGLLERLHAIRGVESAAIAGAHPLNTGFTNSFSVVGREAEAADWPEISVRQVSAGYFQTVGVPLLRGRLLADGDHLDAPPVLLINEAAATRFFPSQDPLGHRVSLWGSRRTIVGVVGDERFHGVSQPAPAAIYLPLAQVPAAGGSVLLRARRDPAALIGPLRSSIRDQDPALAVFGVEPLKRTLSQSMDHERFSTLLLSLFAALALALAVIGVHAVVSYSVVQRRREIGIRMALGAQRASVTRLVVRQGLLPVVAGLGLGVLGALALTRLLTSLLFEVRAADATVFGGVVVALSGIALLASYLPARRASLADPVAPLRGE